MINLEQQSIAVTSTVSPKQETKNHLRGSTLLLTGRIIAMVANFIVQVLIVRYLPKSDFGAFAYALSLVSLGSSLSVFGFDKTVTRFIPMYQERSEYPKVFGSILMMVSTVFSIGFFLVLIVLGLRGWISTSLVSNSLSAQLLFLLIFLTPIQALDSLLVGMFAIFSKPNNIFFRRYILGPALRLSVVLLLILFQGDVFFLSRGLILAGAVGIILYYGVLIRDLKKQDLWKHFNRHQIKFPIKEIFAFSTPVFTSSFVFMARTHLVIIMLEYFQTTSDVATYRAVQPVAHLNMIVIQSFALLFMPSMARMFARKDEQAIDNLYWQSAVWMTVISFPIFLLTFSMAEPLTLLLFGERYAGSGLIMAVLALGYYFNAALGFNVDTLRIYGRFRYTIIVDFVTTLICVVLALILIPRYGTLGAAIATCATLIIYNILNHIGLKLATQINFFDWNYLRVYLSISVGTLLLAVLQRWLNLPIYLGILLAGVISLVVLLLNRAVLNVENTFPELLRFRIVRLLFASSHDQHTEQVKFFMDHIQQNASKYYRGFRSEQTQVHLVDKQERRSAFLYQFNVHDNTKLHSVFVKVFRPISKNGQSRQSPYEKHLLYPITDPQERYKLHYTALSSMYEYFTNLNQKPFGAIRVLDVLPNWNAVLTEGSSDVKLRQLFWRKNGSYSLLPNRELTVVFQNVGAWLNHYHNMPKENVTARYPRREDYIETILTLKEFLIRILGDESFFNQVSATIVDKAQKILPDSLPLGLVHGDFAQRNILVGPNARVSVLDTFTNWRTPIYYDIGFFLNDLKMAYPQAMSHNFKLISNQLMAYEKAFLQGYFAPQPIPYPTIRLYEILALLDKWSSTLARSHSSNMVRRFINKLKNPYFKRRLKSLHAELAKNES